MKDRWIKLYASTLTDAVFTDTDSDTLKVWIWILLSVFYKPNTVFVGNKQVELLPGQMIFGRKAAGIKLGIHPSKVYRIVQKLAKKGCISIKTTKKFSVITVNNWAEYQNGEGVDNYGKAVDNSVDKSVDKICFDEEFAPEWNNKRTEDEQQMNTIKKEKNVKNEYNISSSLPPAREEEDPEKIPRVIGGTLGRNALVLSDEQFNHLLEIMPFDKFNYYCQKLADFIVEKKRNVNNHYDLIKGWFYEDYGRGV